jgi:ribosome-binding factor A
LFRPSAPSLIQQKVLSEKKDFARGIGVKTRIARHDDDLRDTMSRHHQRESSRTGSQRQLRVGETVRHAVADILAQGGVHDPVLEGHLITVPEVRMSPDLKLATIYVMPLGGRDTEIVLAALERNKKFLRGEVARRVNLKFAPDIRFRVDDRFDEAERIEKLLRTPAVQKDLEPDSDES